MKTVAVCCLKNEADLVEPLVRHTCQLVDRMVVLDDGSHDESPMILQQLTDEGLPLDVITLRSLGKDQKARMTRLICDEAGHRLQADWILAIDADEFLNVPEGSSLIPQDIPPDTCLGLLWRGYVVQSQDNSADRNPITRLRHRRVFEPRPTFKLLIPGHLARQPGGWIEQGNHYYWVGGTRTPCQMHPTTWLGHFPLRSAGQHLIRVLGTQLAYLTMPDRNPEWGWSNREPFELFKDNPEGFAETLEYESLHYATPHARELKHAIEVVDDPFPYRGGPLRYTSPTRTVLQACGILARMAEQLAVQHAIVASNADPERVAAQARIVTTLQDTLLQRERERSHWVGQIRELREHCERYANENPLQPLRRFLRAKAALAWRRCKSWLRVRHAPSLSKS